MMSLIKYELEKLVRNRTFLVTSIVSLVIIAGIFLVGYYYSQLSYAEQNNEEIGYPEYYSEITNKYTGDFNDQIVEEVLSDYMVEYQSHTVEKRPLDLFSWYIASVFFPKEEDMYLKMNDAMENGQEITFHQMDVPTVQEVGFASFDKPLKLGAYNTWGNLFLVTNNMFLLASLFIIFICASVFSNEAASKINQLLLSTKYGRGKLTIAKIIVAAGVSTLIFFVIQLISFLFFNYYYGMSGWDASIQTNFSVMLYDFPLEMNNLQAYLLVIGVQLLGLLSVVGITLLISSMTKSPFISLAVSLGIFFLPYLSGQIYQTGIVAKILNLFPIQHYQVEEMLTKMEDNSFFFFSSFIPNVILTIGVTLIIKIGADLLVYFRMKYSQVK
ncbi:ABC transporter permease [Oceanobacillus neutriphilus]|uniref:Membrane protein n=1 Tax=Oceanobacillus neutriphilus TaxID=531815 RepID=A0ABQ2P310_9BACI|nr:ABC transporter permease subunit [Oceanobacillus neutriphilus]GGP16959.1 membrane protein [Oceanobacillus neutriphilus]